MASKCNDIFIIGAGGFAREVLCIIDRVNNYSGNLCWRFRGFVDLIDNNDYFGYPVISDDQLLNRDSPIYVVVAIGNPVIRSNLLKRYSGYDHVLYPNLIDPAVLMLNPDRISFGKGNILCAGSILTTDIQLGSYNIINLSCTVGHDTVLGDNNVINPTVNISGEVNIGNNCLIGTGAKILQQLSIGNNAVVGAGAVVIKNVSASSTVVGVPAKPVIKGN